MLTQIRALAYRRLMWTLRQPFAIIPAIAFPLIFLAVITGGVRSATNLPGFPAESYFAFAIAGAFVQGTMLGGIGGATELAIDVESGFLNRLSLTRVQAAPLLIGQLAGGLGVALIQISTILAVGLIFGVRPASGVLGLPVLVAHALLISLAFSGFGATLALRTGSGESLQSAFPLFFVVLSFSSFFLPRELIPVDWFRTIATYNPASYLIEGIRSLIITGWDGVALARGFGISAALAVVSLTMASRQLRARLARS